MYAIRYARSLLAEACESDKDYPEFSRVVKKALSLAEGLTPIRNPIEAACDASDTLMHIRDAIALTNRVSQLDRLYEATKHLEYALKSWR